MSSCVCRDRFYAVSLCYQWWFWERNKAGECEVRVKVFLVKFIDARCPTLRDVGITKDLTDNRSILAFCQGIVIAYMDVGKEREHKRKDARR